MPNRLMQAALKYKNDYGFSVIPVENKKALVRWTPFQKEIASDDQIKEWWEKWPTANIAIITGKISNITVVDIDSYKMTEKEQANVQEKFPVTATPTANSPRGGEHRYFEYDQDIPTRNDVMTGIDIKNDGGMIIAPPSKNGNGNYVWNDRARIDNITCRSFPEKYKESISDLLGSYNNINSFYIGGEDNTAKSSLSSLSSLSSFALNFEQGSRDQTLFHIANCLVKGGMKQENIQSLMQLINANICRPPLKESEVISKLQSALKRDNTRNISFAQEVRDFICLHNGFITTSFCLQCLHLSSREEKKKLSTVLVRLEAEGLIKKTKNRAGEYKIIDNRVEISNINEVKDEDPIDIKLPFGLEHYVNIMRGNLILFCGVTNAGKSAMLLEMVRLNMKKHNCTYFSSEMSKSLIKRRISKHDSETNWNFGVVDNWDNNFDVLRKDELNFIDWIEEEEAWRVKARLTEAQSAIGRGVGIIALQKNPNADMPWGGPQTLNKSALAFTIDFIDPQNYRKGVRMRIKKCKEPIEENVSGWIVEYNTYNGINFSVNYEWGPEIDRKYKEIIDG